MTKPELIVYLDELIEAAGIIRDKVLSDHPIKLVSHFCRGIDNRPEIQFHRAIRQIAEILEIGVVEKDHDEDYNEIGVMYRGWYLFELEDKEVVHE